jgi:hypothetical protein
MTKPIRPTFMAITSTGGYIGRWYWYNTGIHPDLPHWGAIEAIPDSTLPNSSWPVWAGKWPAVRQVINWRFYEHD